jgi:uncharacterized membrane protein
LDGRREVAARAKESGGLGKQTKTKHKEDDSMNKAMALMAGLAAWAAVALVAALLAFNIGDKNQILMFLPILAAVVVAWAVGEVVTERVFGGHGREEA